MFTKIRQSAHIQKWLNEKNKIIEYVIYVLLFVIITATVYSNILPETIDVKPYTFAKQDIQSPIEIEDTNATKEKKDAVASEIKDVYVFQEDKALKQIEKVEDIFRTIEQLNQTKVKSEMVTKQSQDEKDETIPEERELTMTEKINKLKSSMPNFIGDEISTKTLRTLFSISSSELNFAKETITSTINQMMSEKIGVSQIEFKKLEVKNHIPTSGVSEQLYSALVEIARSAITYNYVFDAEQTKKNRTSAMNEVAPVMIREGQVLVREGDMITQEVMDKLELVGLLDKESNPYPFIGLFGFGVFITSLIAYFLNEAPLQRRKRITNILMYFFLFSLTIILIKLSSLIIHFQTGIGFIMPVAFGTMMIKMLLDEKLAIISSIVFSVCGSIMFNTGISDTFNIEYGLYILFSCLAGIIFLGRRNVKSKILQTGVFVSLINAIIVLMMFAFSNGQYNLWTISSNVGFAILSGFLSSVLTLGLLPFFEAGFKIITTMKLNELSNPNHPLLRKLLMEAPGTYHHSVVVANLSEAACESVGANGLLARVGSYFHDLGKTKRPHFFIENQLNMENPHNKIAPQLSKTIIIAHPYDGAQLLKEHKLPKEIIEIAEQHHGTTLLKYFYYKAQETSDQEIPELEFRYPGPKAQSKEAAIVGISDAVEAAVRSLSKPNPHKIENLVKKIIWDRLEDGQLDECDLTLKDLDTISQSLCETLQGMFHSRIEYPEEMKKKVKQA